MAKITVNRLTPGAEFWPDVVFDGPLNAIGELNASGVSNDQMERNWARFRIPVHIPWVDSKFFHENRLWAGSRTDNVRVVNKRPLIKAFTLPPLQEWFASGPDGDNTNKSTLPVDSIPPIILDYVMFSFDQADSTAARAGQWYGYNSGHHTPTGDFQYSSSYYDGAATTRFAYHFPNPHESKALTTRQAAYDVWLGLYEKDQIWFSVNQGDYANQTQLSKMLWQAEIGSVEWRFPPASNPAILPTTGIRLQPGKTYALALDIPNLHDYADDPPVVGSDTTGVTAAKFGGADSDESLPQHAVMYSVWMWLACRMPLVPRDERATTTWIIQNEPANDTDPMDSVVDATTGSKKGDTISTTTPVGSPLGTIPMLANGSGAYADLGFMDAVKRVDQEIEDGLRGGYLKGGRQRPFDHLQDDAAYDVIAFDLGHGGGFGCLMMEDIIQARHSGNGGTQGVWCIGRAAIPHGFVVHHVVLALNWLGDVSIATNSFELGQKPEKGAVEYRCGVGIATGGQGSEYGYQQVAHVTYNDTNGRNSNHLIDVVDWAFPEKVEAARLSNPTQGPDDLYVAALVDVPLIQCERVGVDDGYGYSFNPKRYTPPAVTGTPFYVGEGWGNGERMHSGAGLAIPGGAATDVNSTIAGAERYLEARLHIIPAKGAPYVAGAPPTWNAIPEYRKDDVLVGYGGHSVYVFGKRPLVVG
jgi:hypothetical protein